MSYCRFDFGISAKLFFFRKLGTKIVLKEHVIKNVLVFSFRGSNSAGVFPCPTNFLIELGMEFFRSKSHQCFFRRAAAAGVSHSRCPDYSDKPLSTPPNNITKFYDVCFTRKPGLSKILEKAISLRCTLRKFSVSFIENR